MSILFMVVGVVISWFLVKVVQRLGWLHELKNPLSLNEDYFVPIGPARCEACGGDCDGDLDKCFANMEKRAEDELEVPKPHLIPDLMRCGCGRPVSFMGRSGMIYCDDLTCKKARIAPGPHPKTAIDVRTEVPGSVSVDIRTSRVSVKVRGGGNVSIDIEAIEARIDHPMKSLFKPSDVRSD